MASALRVTERIREHKKYNERKLVGIKGNHPLRLSIINLAIVKSTVKEKLKSVYNF